MKGRPEGGAAGALHPDIEGGDAALLLEQLQAIWVGDPKRGSELRQLHLTLFLGSLHTSRAGAVARPTAHPRQSQAPLVSVPVSVHQPPLDRTLAVSLDLHLT